MKAYGAERRCQDDITSNLTCRPASVARHDIMLWEQSMVQKMSARLHELAPSAQWPVHAT